MQKENESYNDYLLRLAREDKSKRIVHLDDDYYCTIEEAERNYALRDTTPERKRISQW